jgi:hypothetical protein
MITAARPTYARHGPDQADVRASIIIVSYNSADHIQPCLDSLRADLGDGCEVIVVDNHSSDSSAQMVAGQFPEVRLMCNSENRGFAAACNQGAQAAYGEMLAFLNPDVRVEAGWLEALKLALERDPRAGLATSKILMQNAPDMINACGNQVHLSGLALVRGIGAQREEYDTLETVDAVSGAAFAIRRELFERLQGFDEDFFLYVEDTDLSWRARLAGYECLYAPESVVYHDYQLKFGPHKTYYQERNRYLLLLKSLHGWTLLVLLPVLLLAELVTWGFVLARDRCHWKNKLRAYAWIARNWKCILAKRRAVQAQRSARDRDLLLRSAYRLEFEQTGARALTLLAHLVFDPLFFLLKGLIWLLVWG